MNMLYLAGELALLYVLSRALTTRLFQLFFLLFRSRTIAVTLITLLQFPGTVVHELAHLFTAEILGVRTGKLSLVPENIREEHITAGSVMIAKTDPFRRYAIGLAPIFSGIIVLAALSQLVPINLLWSDWSDWFNWSDLAIIYLLFALSNAMFSSKEDLKGFIPFAIVLTMFAGFFYYLGLRIGLTGALADFVVRITQQLAISLGIVLGINLGLFLITLLCLWLIQTLTRTRIASHY